MAQVKNKARGLLSNGKYDEAVQLITSKKAEDALAFELAYGLNRLNKTAEAIAVLDKVKGDDIKVRHLRAQLLVKEEKFAEAADLYADLVSSVDEQDYELFSNYLACVVQLGDRKRIDAAEKATNSAVGSSYDVAFNAASALLAKGQYTQAVQYLTKAKELCEQTATENDWSAEQLADELGRIQVQRSYVLLRQHNPTQAKAVLEEVNTDKKLKLPQTQAVANNNLAVLCEHSNLFDAQKKLRAVAHKEADAKLNTMQRLNARYNNVLLQIRTGQPAASCLSACESLQNEFPASDVATLATAAVHCREKNFRKAEQSLRAYLTTPTAAQNTERVWQALAQILLQQKQAKEAAQAAQEMPAGERKLPTVLAIARELRAQQLWDAAVTLLTKSAEDFIPTANTDVSARRTALYLLNEAAALQCQAGQYADAAAICQRALKIDGQDSRTLSTLVAAQSHFDIEAAERTAERVPKIDDDRVKELLARKENLLALQTPKSVGKKDKEDVEEEGSKSAANSGAAAAAASGEAETLTQAEIARRKAKKAERKRLKRKKRKNPHPAKVTDGKPDPERWIRLKDRTTYKKVLKKGRRVGK